jgi:hypothetical protein
MLLQRAWAAGVLRVISGACVCVGLTVAIWYAPYGPDPEDLARDVHVAIRANWKADPQMKTAFLRDVTIARNGGREYVGVVEATIDGRRERFQIDIVVHGERFRWTLLPLPD